MGFWVRYRYEEGLGGTISLGRNGDPFKEEYALVKWTDNSNTAIENMKYIGFTVGQGSAVSYGANCVLAEPTASNSAAAIIASRDNGHNVGNFAQGVGGGAFGFPSNPLLLGQQPSSPMGQQQQYGSSLTPATLLAMQQQFLQQQQQQQQPYNFMSPLGRQGSTDLMPEEAPAVPEEEEKEVIIEPVLRNRFLTKVARMMAWEENEDEEEPQEETDEEKEIQPEGIDLVVEDE